MHRDGGEEMKQKLMGLNGDEAAAYATKQVDPDVVAAYPITPQTIIVERFSEYVADGQVHSEFVAVESEHSALSSCIGAAAAGARAYTATAANGLALMWEMTYIASGVRLPIVMSVVNRALSAPLNIHNDHSDSMGARDSGWIQIYCENSQEVYDAHVEAWRIAEHEDVLLPVMICFDGYTISHTMENVMTLPDEDVKGFVGKRGFIKVQGHLGEAELRLDPSCPISMGPVDLQDFYFEHKVHQMEAMDEALKVIPTVDKEYGVLSGRNYSHVHPYRMEDAEVAILGLGSAMGTTRAVVDELRGEGVKAGMVKLRTFRPFPAADLMKVARDAPVLGVIEKDLSFGAVGSPLYEDVRATFYGAGSKPLVANYVHGLGGRDTSMAMIRGIYEDLLKIKRKGRVDKTMNYVGLRE
jgi:pyruvate ferredoxin oxidoreductase alpha subunit